MSRLTEQILNRVVVRRQEEEDGEFSRTEHLGSTVFESPTSTETDATYLSNLAPDNPLDLGVTDGTRFVHNWVNVQDEARETESRTFKTKQQPPVARGDGPLDAKVIYDSWVDYPGAFNEETIVLHPVLIGSFVQPQPGLMVSVQVTWDSATDFEPGDMWWFTDGVRSSWYQIISSTLIGESLIALTLLNPNIDQTFSTLGSGGYEAIPGNAAIGSTMDAGGIFVRRRWYRNHDDGAITTAVLDDFEQPEIGESVAVSVADGTLFSGTTGQYAYFFDGVNEGWYTVLAEGSVITVINTGLGGSADPGTTMKGSFGRITPRPGINWTGDAVFSATYAPPFTAYDNPAVTVWTDGSYTNRFLFRQGRHLSINHDVTGTTATTLTTVQNKGYPYHIVGSRSYSSVNIRVNYRRYQGDFDFRTIWHFPDTFDSYNYSRGFTYASWAGTGVPLTGWTSNSGDASEVTTIFLYDGTSKSPPPSSGILYYTFLEGNSRFCRQLSPYPGTVFRMFMRNNENIAQPDYTYGWHGWTYYFLMEFLSATRFSYFLPEDPEEEIYYWQIDVKPIEWNLPSGTNDLTGFGFSQDDLGAFLEYRGGGGGSPPPANQGDVIQSFAQKIELPDTGYVRILGTGESLTASATVSVLGGPTLALNDDNDGSNRSSWVYVGSRETILTVSVENGDTLGTNPVGGCGFKLEYIPDTYLTIED